MLLPLTASEKSTNSSHAWAAFYAVSSGSRVGEVWRSMCLSVCPLAYLNGHLSKFHQIISIGPSLTAMQHVMYFRFCGRRHV